MNKYNRLEEHRERLIFLNNVNHYTQNGHLKIEKYYKLLLQIRKEKTTILNKQLC